MTFKEDVYRIVKKIPKGKVATYKDIANALGTRAYQAVGQILAKNKNSFYHNKDRIFKVSNLETNGKGFLDGGNIPCHRVVPSDGSIGGFCGKKCGEKVCKKKKLLEKEGIRFDKDNKVKDFEKRTFRF